MAETQQTPKKHDNAALEKIYNEADSIDNDVFSEMRSNLLLVAGEHYNRRNSNFYRRIRDSRELNEQQKLRLTKNHVQKITKTYIGNMISLAPGVGFEPKNESELQDQKAAELHHAVWRDAVDKYSLEDEELDNWASDYVTIGEVCTKIFWDPDEGPIKAYQQKMDEMGQPMVDEMGQPMADTEMPVHTGAFVFEEVFGFNLLRAPEARSMRKSPYLIIKKMVAKEKLLAKWGDDPEKSKFIVDSADETYIIFDNVKGNYRKTKNEVMIKEFFFRPCYQYPQGWFFIKTKEGILDEAELPGGIFPIAHQCFETFQTTPRGRSPIKTMRPYQAEINRASSKIAEHQITLGDDKLLIQNGTTVAAGVALPGVRSINYTGMTPTILAGRDGSQYLAYLQAQIEELYSVMGVAEDSEEIPAQLDPYAMLFRAASQKKKWNRNLKRFEKYLRDVADIYIRLAKIHMPDDAVVYAIGRNEQINMAEFRSATDLCYQIKLVAQSEDIETKLGKQMVMNQVLQYVGPQLQKDDIGKLIRAMPYTNAEESFSDLTIDYDGATNNILALDRGENPPLHTYDNHVYMIKRLVSRMRQADFASLNPQIQKNYEDSVMAHEQMEAQNQQQIQAAEAGYIPTGGYMVVCDIYVADPAAPDKTRRARIPYESMQWLIQKLETQGQSLDQLELMNHGAQAQMATMISNNKNGMPTSQGTAQGNPPQGTGMPRG